MKLSTSEAALLCAALEAINVTDSDLYCRLAAPLPFSPFRSGLAWLEHRERDGAEQM